MQFTVELEDAEPLKFECADNPVSHRVCEDILRGKTYPFLPFVDDVQVVFDVGANCGATTVHLARHYPDAQVHAFEPGSRARGYLEHNVAAFPNAHVHPIGLYSVDSEMPLYLGDGDLGMSSILPRAVNLAESELVQLRAGGSWTQAHAIERIDVLKVDVEGVEVDVLMSLADLFATMKIVYVEYDSRRARRLIAALLDPTHELYVGSMLLDQGEVIYLRRDIADRPEATEHLRNMLLDAIAEGR
jgi:FkbM family methyltransferase